MLLLELKKEMIIRNQNMLENMETQWFQVMTSYLAMEMKKQVPGEITTWTVEKTFAASGWNN